MSLQDLTTVLRHLPKLDEGELEKVKLKIGACVSLNGGGKEAPSPSDYLLDGIVFELRRRGLLKSGSSIPWKLVTRDYREASEEVRLLLASHVGNLSSVEFAALGQLSIRALAHYLENGHVPISIGTLMKNISKVPTALDASYPGYLEAGLLTFCWRK